MVGGSREVVVIDLLDFCSLYCLPNVSYPDSPFCGCRRLASRKAKEYFSGIYCMLARI